MSATSYAIAGVVRAALIGAALLAAFIYIAPKVRLHPATMGITNNNWNHDIRYSSPDGDLVVVCDFFGHDSSPYWEGQNTWDDESVCGALPVYLHRGLPPREVRVVYNGRTIDLRAPLLWGRLV